MHICLIAIERIYTESVFPLKMSDRLARRPLYDLVSALHEIGDSLLTGFCDVLLQQGDSETVYSFTWR